MNEIIKGLYLGDMSDAHTKGVTALSVMWSGEEGEGPFDKHIETTKWTGESIDVRTVASLEAMNEAADWIRDHLLFPEPVLVYCAFGMERSPLTIAWYLMRHKGYTIDEAYRLLKGRRPMVQDRRHWLPENWKESLYAGLDFSEHL